MHLEIDPLVEEEVKVEIGEIIIIETITDPITETDQEADGTIIGQVIGVTITRLTIDKVAIDQIMDKTLNGHLETEIKVEIELEITTMTIQEIYARAQLISQHVDAWIVKHSTPATTNHSESYKGHT